MALLKRRITIPSSVHPLPLVEPCSLYAVLTTRRSPGQIIMEYADAHVLVMQVPQPRLARGDTVILTANDSSDSKITV
jgi:hypothetical protein